MKRIAFSLLLFFIGLTLFLIATLPVRFGLQFLPDNIPIQITGAQGTIWNGEAANLHWQNQSLGRLTWKLHALPLFTAQLAADFTLAGDHLNAQGKAHIKMDQSIQLTDTRLHAELSALPIPKAHLLVTPEGALNAVIRNLVYAKNLVQTADADFFWNPARITSPVKYDLGELELKVTGNNAELTGKLDSRNGPIKVDGTLDLSPQGSLRADIQVSPTQTTPKELRDMLPMLGKPNNQGAIRLKQTIQIPNWPS
jgi:general secretion pathway protein N